jgi:hypothetical protein
VKITRYGKWIRYLPFALVIAFLCAEQSSLLKTSSITAVACTRELLTDDSDAMAIIARHEDAIGAAARRHDLPPEFIAAIIYGHQRGLTPKRKFTDCAGSALGADLSLGLAQVRLSTAAANDALELSDVSPALFKRYRAMLLDPMQNIEYQSRELRRLLDRANRFPGITAEELIHNPFAMTLIMSEYRARPQETPAQESKLSGNAFFDLQQMMRKDLYIFERDEADVALIRDAVTQYLEYIHCESGIFNASVCDDWNNRLKLLH